MTDAVNAAQMPGDRGRSPWAAGQPHLHLKPARLPPTHMPCCTRTHTLAYQAHCPPTRTPPPIANKCAGRGQRPQSVRQPSQPSEHPNPKCPLPMAAPRAQQQKQTSRYIGQSSPSLLRAGRAADRAHTHPIHPHKTPNPISQTPDSLHQMRP